MTESYSEEQKGKNPTVNNKRGFLVNVLRKKRQRSSKKWCRLLACQRWSFWSEALYLQLQWLHKRQENSGNACDMGAWTGGQRPHSSWSARELNVKIGRLFSTHASAHILSWNGICRLLKSIEAQGSRKPARTPCILVLGPRQALPSMDQYQRHDRCSDARKANQPEYYSPGSTNKRNLIYSAL